MISEYICSSSLLLEPVAKRLCSGSGLTNMQFREANRSSALFFRDYYAEQKRLIHLVALSKIKQTEDNCEALMNDIDLKLNSFDDLLDGATNKSKGENTH